MNRKLSNSSYFLLFKTTLIYSDVPFNSWLHFIYGDKKPKAITAPKSKKLNTRHRLAYLPPVLHQYEHQITDRIESEEEIQVNQENEEDSKVDNSRNKSFSSKKSQLNDKVIENQIEDFDEKSLKTSRPETTLPDVEGEEFIITDSYRDQTITFDKNKEDKEKAHLKTLLRESPVVSEEEVSFT